MFAHDLCPSQIGYFRNAIVLDRKDRASILRKTGYAGQERYHKSSIVNRQSSIPVYPDWDSGFGSIKASIVNNYR
jgi:hypothetical protein